MAFGIQDSEDEPRTNRMIGEAPRPGRPAADFEASETFDRTTSVLIQWHLWQRSSLCHTVAGVTNPTGPKNTYLATRRVH
jgi:hypothetical protein